MDKTAGRAAGVQETGDGGVESGAVLLNMGFYADQIGAVTGLLKSRMIVDRRKESMQHDIGCNHPPVGHRFGKIFYGGRYRREDACPICQRKTASTTLSSANQRFQPGCLA